MAKSAAIPEKGTRQYIRTLIAHEAVHTRQKKSSFSKHLVESTIYEGVCDFVVYDLLQFPIEGEHHRFGESRECEVWKTFERDLMAYHGQQKIKWLYGGDHPNHGYPADMGYFVGRKIAAAYYASAKDKTQALKKLMTPKKYRRIFRESGYAGNCK